MRRTPPPPPSRGCKGPAIFGSKPLFGLHDWQWKSWNGNDRRVLPFHEGTRGVCRSGYRCYHCGAMAWDESDLAFAAAFAKNAYGVDPIRAISEAVEAKFRSEAT